MLSAINRLSSRGDFSRLFSKGRAVHAAGVTLKTITNGRESCRVGFVVSTKVSKKAVVRNRLRRRLREAVRAHLGKIKPGYDLVFITRPEMREATFAEVTQAVAYLLTKAGLEKA